MRALLLTGGVAHDFADAAPAVSALLGAIGIEARIETDLESGFAAWADDPGIDLLVVYALRWRMLAERYAALRAEWAYSPSSAVRRAVQDGVAAGRPLLGLHTAAICFDDWPDWGAVLGGAWQWERSFHPPCGPAAVRLDGVAHPITAGLPGFEVRDEVYSDLALQPGLPVLASAAAGDTAWPVLWARQYGAGRVVCDLLGHDRAAIEHPVHRRLIQRAAAWATGGDEARVRGL